MLALNLFRFRMGRMSPSFSSSMYPSQMIARTYRSRVTFSQKEMKRRSSTDGDSWVKREDCRGPRGEVYWMVACLSGPQQQNESRGRDFLYPQHHQRQRGKVKSPLPPFLLKPPLDPSRCLQLESLWPQLRSNWTPYDVDRDTL